MSTHDVVGLAGVVRDAVNELKQRTQQVRDELQANLQEARETVEHVGSMSKGLKNAVADLKGALGLTTNSPPESDTPTGGEVR